MEIPKIVGEIACNHKGDFKVAKEMIVTAKQFCKIGVVKFQKRNPRESLPEKVYNAPHPNPENSYGSSYGQHREFLEFDKDQHKALKEFCDSLEIEYSCSVWDVTSAKKIISLNPPMIKIPLE